MKKKIFFKNLENQKGVTGADIVIAVTILLITISVVSIIYVNTTLESRNVTRTAGATRIATNILENIEKLSYDEFVTNFNQEITSSVKQTTSEYLNYYLTDGGTDGKLFSTKIPNGYDVYIKAEPNYGSHTSNTKEQFDLIRDVKVIFAFNVGDITEKVDFQTVKKREIIGESNEPSTEYLTSDGILGSGMNYYPVKYVSASNAYVKVNTDDKTWYNYSNKEWATVIVSKKEENQIFDINGKFYGTIDTDENSSNYTVKYVWIPRFYTKTISGVKQFYAFAYLGTGRNKIVSDKLNSNYGSSITLAYNTFKAISSSEGVNSGDNFGGKTGKWVKVQGEFTSSSDESAYLLNTSKYGPYIIH